MMSTVQLVLVSWRDMDYHSHLGEVDKTVLGVVGCPLFDEGQIS